MYLKLFGLVACVRAELVELLFATQVSPEVDFLTETRVTKFKKKNRDYLKQKFENEESCLGDD